jgi:hypothetical protein
MVGIEGIEGLQEDTAAEEREREAEERRSRAKEREREAVEERERRDQHKAEENRARQIRQGVIQPESEGEEAEAEE